MYKLFLIILMFLCNGIFAQSPLKLLTKKYTSAASLDDSAAFVSKVVNDGGSLTSTEKTAIGTLIRQLKDSSLWDRFLAIYPMVGGSSIGCAVNLKDTSKYTISWINSPTFSSTGVSWGVSGYGNTNLLPITDMSLNNAHLSYYSRDNISNSSALEMGANNPSTPIDRTYFGIQSSYGIGSTNATNFSNSNTTGLFTVARTTSSIVAMYRNGLSVSTVSVSSVGMPSYNIFIGTRNSGGGPTGSTPRSCAFASIGFGLTSAQVATLYNIIQAFETALSRQV